MYTYDHNVDTYQKGAYVYLLLHVSILSTNNFQKRFCPRRAYISPANNGESIFLDDAMSCFSVWPYIFRLTKIQFIVATQHCIVTKVAIIAPPSAKVWIRH